MAATLQAEQRKQLKKSYTNKIRQAGKIPAIVYGKDNEPKTIAVSSIDLLKTVRDEGRNAVISLVVDGESVDVMLHDYQTDPLKDELVHADFYIVNMSKEMDVEVPIRLDGEAQGSKDGGVLQQPLYNLAVRAKPADIPEEILIDVSELAVGDTITVADLKSGKNFEILEDEETTIVTISAPDNSGEHEDEDSDVTEEDAEPEVINDKQTDEE